MNLDRRGLTFTVVSGDELSVMGDDVEVGGVGQGRRKSGPEMRSNWRAELFVEDRGSLYLLGDVWIN